MISTAVITLVSAARLDHANVQTAAMADQPELRCYWVWLDEQSPPAFDGTVIHLPPGRDGLRLAAGRNAGADAAIAAGADLLVFLDADCVPGESLFERYRAASLEHPDAVLCGPVTYLAEGYTGFGTDELAHATNPHPARPVPPDDQCVIAAETEYRLFWSLSFAATAFTWRRAGGFAESYEGYGGEDTDFASTLAERGVPLVWVGGAHAYHQYHPTSNPPWQHLDDILRNAGTYHRRWGTWPMEGWLTAFAHAGAIGFVDGAWVRLPRPLATAGEQLRDDTRHV